MVYMVYIWSAEGTRTGFLGTGVCGWGFPGSLGTMPSSQPSILTHHSVTVVCWLFSSSRSPHTAPTNIARAAPNPAHTLFSRLCLSACTCHGSLQGTVQTACSAFSPAPCFSCDQEHLHVCQSCDFENVCLMCLASANCPFPQFWPDPEALVASLPQFSCLPAWQVVQACLYSHCFVHSF